MADTYDVSIAILVQAGSNGETIADESTTFNAQSFAKMSALANRFYELVATLQKLK